MSEDISVSRSVLTVLGAGEPGLVLLRTGKGSWLLVVSVSDVSWLVGRIGNLCLHLHMVLWSEYQIYS